MRSSVLVVIKGDHGLRPRRVLVVEDDDDFRQFLIAALEDLGYDCLPQLNPSALISESIPDSDVVLVDLMMPDVDGIEVLRQLAACKSSASVILMSGIARRVLETAEKAARALGLKVAGALQKPFRLYDLREVLERSESLQSPAVVKTSEKGIGEAELRLAIAEDEFELHYQPQICLKDRRVVGFEGLVRWRHPVRGLLLPDNFIPLLESMGLIEDLTRKVIARGIKELTKLSELAGAGTGISFNVSVHSLQQLDFPDQLLSLAEASGISPARIVVEITESGLVSRVQSSLDVLARLRMKGIRLSIDDFGTGYSMMEQLQTVPATELKIDKTFVALMSTDTNSRIMVEKTIELGHELEMIVVAEGIETPQQLDFLSKRGCDLGQGYLICEPRSISRVREWMPDRGIWRGADPPLAS